jgi:hypothetical protein
MPCSSGVPWQPAKASAFSFKLLTSSPSGLGAHRPGSTRPGGFVRVALLRTRNETTV